MSLFEIGTPYCFLNVIEIYFHSSLLTLELPYTNSFIDFYINSLIYTYGLYEDDKEEEEDDFIRSLRVDTILLIMSYLAILATMKECTYFFTCLLLVSLYSKGRNLRLIPL